MTDTDTAIAGGGPAGAAAAIALARAARRALLLERDAAPREAVCGEFLGPDAAAALARLGLDLPALGAAPLRRLRLGAGRREAALDLPFPAWALPRRALDAALRAAARDAGAEVAAGAAVRGAAPSGEGWRLRLHGGAEVAARRAVLATGKHALRGWPRAPAPPGALGLKLHLSGVEPGPEVVLLRFAGGYAGLLPLPEGEGGGANLCAALQDGAPPGGAARDPAALLARVGARGRAGTGRWRSAPCPTASATAAAAARAGRRACSASATRWASSPPSPATGWRWRCCPASRRRRRSPPAATPPASTPSGAAAARARCAGRAWGPGRCGACPGASWRARPWCRASRGRSHGGRG